MKKNRTDTLPRSPAAAPADFSGHDENCYFLEDLGSIVASSSMTRVNINGQDVTNRSVNASSYPPRRDVT